MMEKQEIIVFISSPNDLKNERDIVQEVVNNIDNDIGDEYRITLKVKMWEQLPPTAENAQEYINKNIKPYDIFLGIMGNRFGTKTIRAESGTQEEFEIAYNSWQATGKPEIMFYFRTHEKPENTEQAEQLFKVMKFRDDLSSKILWKEYEDEIDFERKLQKDLGRKVKDISINLRNNIKLTERIVDQPISIESISIKEVESKWKSSDIYSSFEPGENAFEHIFNLVKIPSTRGWAKKKVKNENETEVEKEVLVDDNFVYFIKDPIRPFGIQIGETRSLRHQGNPTAIPDLTNLDLGSIKNMYPFLQVTGFKWIRMVLAELSTDPKILSYIHEKDPDPHVKSIAARNPSASSELQKEECIFCKDEFLNNRLKPSGSKKTRIIHNDYPYGPYFHYVAFPSRPIHAWEELELTDIDDLNFCIWNYLDDEKTQGNWKPKPAGVFIGLNSTIRHLVMGTRTLTSAGASIPHIHKQIWGMVPGSNSLGNHLNNICISYEGQCDYLGAYLEFLDRNDMILYKDENVVLYIPYGQISIHELQIMMRNPGKNHYLALAPEEIRSLSIAETIAIKFLKELKIKSFNEIMITLPFDINSKYFRLVICFITREVDLAVSELNQLFVVDKHPEDTKDLLMPIKDNIIKKVEETAKLLPKIQVKHK